MIENKRNLIELEIRLLQVEVILQDLVLPWEGQEGLSLDKVIICQYHNSSLNMQEDNSYKRVHHLITEFLDSTKNQREIMNFITKECTPQ